MLVLCAVIFTDMLAFALIIPSLPAVVRLHAGGGLALGLLFTGYSLAQFVAAPLLGRLSDAIGRRPVLLLALAGTSLSLVICALAPNLETLILARVVGGLCGGSIGVAMASLSDMSAPADRTRIMGMGGASIGLAFTIGPALGALASPFGFAAVCLVGAAIAALNFGAALVVLPQVPRPEHRRAAGAPVPASPVFLRLLAMTCLSMIVFVGMEATLGLLVANRFDMGPDLLGWLLALAGLAYVAMQAGLVWRLTGRFGTWRVAAGAASAVGLCILVLLVLDLAPFLVALALAGAAQGALTTVATSAASSLAPAGAVGRYMGINQAASALGRVLGPLLAGLFYDLDPAAAYAVLAGLSAAVAALAVWNELAARRHAGAPAGLIRPDKGTGPG